MKQADIDRVVDAILGNFSDEQVKLLIQAVEEAPNSLVNAVERWTAPGYKPRAIGWISVNDRLPDNSKPVIVFAFNEFVYEASYQKWRNEWDWGESSVSPQNITHWMPLPEPPIAIEEGQL